MDTNKALREHGYALHTHLDALVDETRQAIRDVEVYAIAGDEEHFPAAVGKFLGAYTDDFLDVGTKPNDYLDGGLATAFVVQAQLVLFQNVIADKVGRIMDITNAQAQSPPKQEPADYRATMGFALSSLADYVGKVTRIVEIVNSMDPNGRHTNPPIWGSDDYQTDDDRLVARFNLSASHMSDYVGKTAVLTSGMKEELGRLTALTPYIAASCGASVSRDLRTIEGLMG